MRTIFRKEPVEVTLGLKQFPKRPAQAVQSIHIQSIGIDLNSAISQGGLKSQELLHRRIGLPGYDFHLLRGHLVECVISGPQMRLDQFVRTQRDVTTESELLACFSTR